MREYCDFDPSTCCPDFNGDLCVVCEDVSKLRDMIAGQSNSVQITWVEKFCRPYERIVEERTPNHLI
ncbi:hypothetical protein ROBYS_20130 [Roseobacter sp. OBYS 0001]|nr:hypothetical protein ROBYS_20130 [Roseobacter sp. OBYS 0001]